MVEFLMKASVSSLRLGFSDSNLTETWPSAQPPQILPDANGCYCACILKTECFMVKNMGKRMYKSML